MFVLLQVPFPRFPDQSDRDRLCVLIFKKLALSKTPGSSNFWASFLILLKLQIFESVVPVFGPGVFASISKVIPTI